MSPWTRELSRKAIPLCLVLTGLGLGLSAERMMPRARADSGQAPAVQAQTEEAEMEGRLRVIERTLGLAESIEPRALLSREQEWERVRLRLARLEGQQAEIWRSIPSITPVEGARVSSPYTSRRYHPIRQRYQEHVGTDLAAAAGTPVRAPADGRVSDLGFNESYGYFVDVEHGFGFTTRFGHASRLLTRLGAQVQRGDTIALVGSTGLSTGPHLHYEVYYQGVTVNPQDYLLDGKTRLEPAGPSGWSP